jgi:hypothetical protein
MPITRMKEIGEKALALVDVSLAEDAFTFGSRYKLVTFVFLVSVSLLSFGGLALLKIDTSYESLISKNDVGWPAYEQTVKDFGSDNTTILFLRDENLWTPERLRLAEELVYALRDLKPVEKVESLFSITNIRDKGGILESGPLMDIAPEDSEEIETIRNDALYSPLVRRNLLSDDGKTMAVNVTVRRDLTDPDFNRDFYGQIEEMLGPLRGNFQKIFQIGPPRLNVSIEHGMIADLKFLTPVNFAIVTISILLFLRTFWAAGIPAVTSGLSILWTFGFMGYVGIPITLLTAIIPALVIVIGSTEDTHMLTTYLHGVDGQKELDREEAVGYMARQVGLPLIITAWTTGFGFFTNSVSMVPLIRDFAFASSFAMMANMVITITAVPLLLSIIGPSRCDLAHSHDVPSGLTGIIVGWVEIVGHRYGKQVVIVTAILMIFLGLQALNVRVSNDPLSYFQKSNPLVKDANVLSGELSGMQIFYLTLRSEEPNAFREPENLKRLERVQRFIDDQGVYDRTISLVDHLSLVNRELHNGDPEFFRVPTTRREVDEYMLMFQRGDIERYVTADYRSVNIVVRHSMSDSYELNKNLKLLEVGLENILPPELKPDISGENLMINRAAETLFSGQVDSLMLLIAMIFMIIAALYASPLAGLLSMVPNLIPVLFCFGVMGLFGIPLNPGTATVMAIAVGIAIDDTIHLMMRYASTCRKEPDQFQASLVAVRTEAVPIIATSISLALGFSTLISSDFAIVSQFGVLAAATMVFALFADLLVTPVLLRQIRIVGVWDVAALNINKEALLKSPLFRDMSVFKIKKTILLSRAQEFITDEMIIEQGTQTKNMYVVLTGKVEVVVRSGEGREVQLCVLGPGEVFGEVGFAGEILRTATVRAVDTTHVMSLDYEMTRNALRFYPHIASQLYHNISYILSARLAQANHRLETSENIS